MSRQHPVPSTSPTPKTFTLSPPSRQVLSRKLAASLFAPLSQQPYTTINLSGAALGDAAVIHAGSHLLSLAGMKCLETVILSDIIASLPRDEALRSLTAISSSIGVWKQLRSVDLSHNALGSDGISACRALFAKQPYLEMVFLSETGLAAESVRLLCDFLQPAVNNLRVLDVHGNRLDSAGLERIAALVEKMPRLQRLRASSLGADANAVRSLANALRSTTSLAELDISDNRLDSSAASDLAAVLRQQPNLSRLALSDLVMKDEALTALLEPLTDASHGVAELLLAGNELRSGVVPALGRYIVRHATNLRVLDVSNNELGGDGVTLLAEAFKDSSEQCALTRLMVAHNEATALSIVLLAQQIVKLPALRRFDVRGTDLSDDTVQRLRSAFRGADVLADEGEESSDEAFVQSALQTLATVADVRHSEETESKKVSSGRKAAVQSTMSRIVSMLSPKASEEEEVEQIGKGESVRAGGGGDMSGGGVSETAVFEDDSGTGVNEQDMRTPAGAGSSRTWESGEEGEEEELERSAQKLSRSLACLDRDLFDARGELQLEARREGSGVIYSRREDKEGDGYEVMTELLVDREKDGCVSWIVDALGGLIVAVFLVTLMVGVVQWQEDVVPGFRRV
ncbi:RAN GTPase-activating protein 1 [Gracilariopsis chorda]|uniref:RAN GTPase-activating protein 1 n=1 Tax=Gracilariopsis chorda TaxID=448386 RepID=A0A2V3J6H9_9FLOR|nr:RAN GTPase-activating protein 1 [Gracilariopsis chorda]|eukprot:PXF48980.1 RAN GTPase-activating protein 1 [Gracilariopsis chorda]